MQLARKLASLLYMFAVTAWEADIQAEFAAAVWFRIVSCPYRNGTHVA